MTNNKLVEGKINEIFYSIQGEGIYTGIPQIFLRMHGCNLACAFCDTELNSFDKMKPSKTYEKIKEFRLPYHSVSITGGEPLLQKDFLKTLLSILKQENIKIYLETNGTLFKELSGLIDYIDIIAMDVKLPSSTRQGAYWQEHKNFLNMAKDKEIFVKIVICHSTERKDLEKAIDLVKSLDDTIPFVLQANSKEMGDELIKKLYEFQKITQERLCDARIIPQIHRYLGLK